jgi:hypothetical protein
VKEFLHHFRQVLLGDANHVTAGNVQGFEHPFHTSDARWIFLHAVEDEDF